MGVDIDEPRRERHSRQVDLLRPGRRDPSHSGDTIARDRDVHFQPGRARTVEHRGAAQHEIRVGPRAHPRIRSGTGAGGDAPTHAVPRESESQRSGRSDRPDQATSSYEGTTLQDEASSRTGSLLRPTPLIPGGRTGGICKGTDRQDYRLDGRQQMFEIHAPHVVGGAVVVGVQVV